jgi:ADP-ribose pyrophosphatase YjhB (NUDIX family)
MNYCTHCGEGLIQKIPPDDDQLRHVCPACGRIHYQNPKLVAGCIPLWEDRILICRRAIEPRRGYWTLPAGYLENGETVAQGAARETREETGAEVVDLVPYRMYDIVHVHQVYFIFLAKLQAPTYRPTKESSEVRLIAEPQIPWDEIAFPVIQKALEDYCHDRSAGRFTFAMGEITTRLAPVV